MKTPNAGRGLTTKKWETQESFLEKVAFKLVLEEVLYFCS